MERCDIIIPVWDQLDVTRECVTSILKHTDYPYRLIIVDNGSRSETKDYLLGLKDEPGLDLLLIRNEKNLGFVKAVNQGIVASDGGYLCIMNNDTIAAPGWLGELIDVMKANPSIGLLNPSSNTSGQFPGDLSVEDYGCSLKPMKGQIQELYTCRGFCMVVTREVIKRVGLLDEIYHVGYFDDTDYCKRAQKLGYKTARAKASYVYHKENVSFKTLKDNKKLFEDNEKVFFERWGRHVRLAYLINDEASSDKVDEIATAVARSGHQITVFVKKGLKWPVKIDHFDIRRIDLGPAAFTLMSLYKIARRRKKKALELVLTDSKSVGSFLSMARFAHGADIIVRPEKDRLLEMLSARSRIF